MTKPEQIKTYEDREDRERVDSVVRKYDEQTLLVYPNKLREALRMLYPDAEIPDNAVLYVDPNSQMPPVEDDEGRLVLIEDLSTLNITWRTEPGCGWMKVAGIDSHEQKVLAVLDELDDRLRDALKQIDQRFYIEGNLSTSAASALKAFGNLIRDLRNVIRDEDDR